MSTSAQNIILGLGKSGFSCANYFAERGEDFLVMDSRPEPPLMQAFKQKFPHNKLITGGFDITLCQQAKRLIVSPGIALTEPVIIAAQHKNIPIIGDIELFAEAAKAPVIAITGSNGKSTVTTLLGEIAKNAGIKVAVGGNLGTPALDLLSEDIELYVLELSSFQLETTYSLNLLAATILNLSPDHIDRHGSLENYLLAKQRIYRHIKFAVVNREQPELTQNIQAKKIISFGFDAPTENNFGITVINGVSHLSYGKEKIIAATDLKLLGKHQILNALAAIALAHCYGIRFEAMISTLKNFTGLAHRCQIIPTQDNILWINDSKATNVGAAKASIESIGKSIKGKIILIAGGQGKGADFSELNPTLASYVKAAVIMGEDKPMMLKAFSQVTKTHEAENLKAGVLLAKSLAKADDAVLLAPACASFDMFKNFEDRGEQFVHLVKDLS